MNKDNLIKTPYNKPFIAQRADPYILRADGKYYFTASVPEYDRVVLRCATRWRGCVLRRRRSFGTAMSPA